MKQLTRHTVRTAIARSTGCRWAPRYIEVDTTDGYRPALAGILAYISGPG
jgi:hypothetical protein